MTTLSNAISFGTTAYWAAVVFSILTIVASNAIQYKMCEITRTTMNMQIYWMTLVTGVAFSFVPYLNVLSLLMSIPSLVFATYQLKKFGYGERNFGLIAQLSGALLMGVSMAVVLVYVLSK